MQELRGLGVYHASPSRLHAIGKKLCTDANQLFWKTSSADQSTYTHYTWTQWMAELSRHETTEDDCLQFSRYYSLGWEPKLFHWALMAFNGTSKLLQTMVDHNVTEWDTLWINPAASGSNYAANAGIPLISFSHRFVMILLSLITRETTTMTMTWSLSSSWAIMSIPSVLPSDDFYPDDNLCHAFFHKSGPDFLYSTTLTRVQNLFHIFTIYHATRGQVRLSHSACYRRTNQHTIFCVLDVVGLTSLWLIIWCLSHTQTLIAAFSTSVHTW